MGKGSSAPQPTTQTVQQSNIPEYARPYFEDIMTRGTTASNVQYQPYTGERVESFTPLQQQAFKGIQELGPSPLIGSGAGMTGAAGLGGLGAGQQYQQMATDPNAMRAYMSPYMQNVVDFQKSQAIQDYGRQLPGQQAAAARAGAFGGSRQAIVEAEAQRNLQNQLAGIQAQGTQSAFERAQQAQQFGADLGLRGLGLAGQMGQQFGQLGQQAFGQQAAALEAQQRAGAIQQAQGQQQRDLAYEEFMRQQLYPQSQLQFLSSLLRGSVVAPQQTMYSYQAQPSMVSQIGGLGLGALGISKAFGAKEGGEVPGYADGGITGGDAKVQGVTPSRVTNVKKQLLSGVDPRRIPDSLGVMIALQDRDFVKQLELTSAAKNQQALEGGRQQAQTPSVYDEEMSKVAGLAGMDAGVMEEPYAGGGIVAFNTGTGPSGVPFSAQDILPEDIEEARRSQGRSPYIEESPKERAARLRAMQQQARAASAGLPNIGAGVSSVAPAAEEAGLFSRARTALQPTRFNPSLGLEGLGGLARGAARVGGKFVGPLAALDMGSTAYDLYQTPTDTIKQYYGMSGEPGVVTDTIARSRAALGMLNPFGSTSEDLRKMRAGAAAPTKGAASSLQSQYEAQDRQEGRTQTAPGAQAAPDTRAMPPARAAATSAPAIKPAVDEFADIRKMVSDQEKKLQTEDQAEAARREAYKKIIPDDLQQRLDTYKAEAAQAVQERDKDRWLALTVGALTAAAGDSPYALKNLAQGFGLTAREMMSINKDFRKLENERNKLMREEQRLDRAEKIGVEKDILAARERAAARRDSYDQYKTNVEVNLAKIANDKWKTITETQSAERRTAMVVGGRGDAAEKKDPLLARSNKLALAVADGSATPSEQAEYVSLQEQIKKRSEATKTKAPSALKPSDVATATAFMNAAIKKNDLVSAKRYADMLGIDLPATGGSGKAVLTPGADGVLEYKPAR